MKEQSEIKKQIADAILCQMQDVEMGKVKQISPRDIHNKISNATIDLVFDVLQR